jgi:SAM-dependent methyltransferase
MTSPAPSGPRHEQTLLPSPWIRRFAHLVPHGARVLDVAAGQGRHARFLASRGARVLAVDRDANALASLADVTGIETRTVDLETGEWPFAGDTFDAVVVANYLHRPLFPHLLSAVGDRGVLLYETFALGNERFGHPARPDFLLRRAELLDLAEKRLTVIAFEQGRIDEGREAVVQRVAAVGPAHEWPPRLASRDVSAGS